MQIDDIIDENFKLKEQVSKLSKVVKGLENRTKAGGYAATTHGAPKQKKLVSGARQRSGTRPQSAL